MHAFKVLDDVSSLAQQKREQCQLHDRVGRDGRLALLGERDDGGCGLHAFRVLDDVSSLAQPKREQCQLHDRVERDRRLTLLGERNAHACCRM